MDFNGIFHLSVMEVIIYTLIVTHITIASVTIYLHRHSAHRALDLSPVVSHFFRAWLWLTTGMVTKEWTAIHRKHHAKCETQDDPHSPQILGLKKVLLEGAELYKKEAKNSETLKRYGEGTPNDWLEKNVYCHSVLGVSILLIFNFIMFGYIGIAIWAIQMVWIPFWAAGVINGVAHYYGYKNFTIKDASKNIFPIGILIGGEELHNNHHAYGTSAKLSNKWYEFDIGWAYIRILESLNLAKVKKIAPKVVIAKNASIVTENTLTNLIKYRFDLLSKYGKSLNKEINNYININKEKLNDKGLLLKVKKWVKSDSIEVPNDISKAIFKIKEEDSRFKLLLDMKVSLFTIWTDRTKSTEELINYLKDWCEKAENSGLEELKKLSLRIRSYKDEPSLAY